MTRKLFIIHDDSVLSQLMREAVANAGNRTIVESYINLLGWNHQIVEVVPGKKFDDVSLVIFPNGYQLTVRNEFLKPLGKPDKQAKKQMHKRIKRLLDSQRHKPEGGGDGSANTV